MQKLWLHPLRIGRRDRFAAARKTGRSDPKFYFVEDKPARLVFADDRRIHPTGLTIAGLYLIPGAHTSEDDELVTLADAIEETGTFDNRERRLYYLGCRWRVEEIAEPSPERLRLCRSLRCRVLRVLDI